MRKTSKPGGSADRIAEKATRGEDVSVHFTNEFQVVRPTDRVTVDLTPGTSEQLDQLAARLGSSRLGVIETPPSGALDEGYSVKPKETGSSE